MTADLTFKSLIQESMGGAIKTIAPSLPFAVGFAVVAGMAVWGAGALPPGAIGSIAFFALIFAALYSFCLFSTVVYRALIPADGSIMRAGWKLSLAWLLIVVVASIISSIILLFFSLIGSSLGVVSGENSQNITDMTAQMRAGGTFYPLFAVFLVTLAGVFWFAARLICFGVATVSRNSVHVFRTWYWTKGQIRVLGGGFLLFGLLPLFAFLGAGASVIGAIPSLPLGPVGNGISASVLAFLTVPAHWLGHSFAAYVFARLAPDDAE